MDQVLDDYMKNPTRHATGVGFTLIKTYGNSRVIQRYRGSLGVGSTRAFSDDSFIWLASATKIVTTTAVLIAAQKGLLSLQDSVAMYLPELTDLDILIGFEEVPNGKGRPITKKAKSSITIHQLLTHTSGLAYLFVTKELRKWAAYNGQRSDERSSSLEDYSHPLIFEPGTGWAYGPGLDWAGRIVEVVAHCSLGEFCKRNIWDQIGAHDTTFRPETRPDLLSRRLDITCPTHGGGIAIAQNPYPLSPSNDLGGIGLWTTPRDFNQFLWHLFLKPNGLVTPENLNLILSPQVSDAELVTKSMHTSNGGILTRTFPNQFPLNVGLGTCIALEDIRGRRPKGTVSWLGYPNEYWWFDPENRICGVLYMQLIPAGLSEATELLVDLERAVYREIKDDQQHEKHTRHKL